MSQENLPENENKLLTFLKDKDNLGFIILISIAFVGFSFKIVDIILKNKRNKKEQNLRNLHGHHHSHHHHHHLHHPKHHGHPAKRKH
jgi:UDP-N-acetylmuramyl pentapeptide phosphotransferase/UDP-N-acetylglucosamine-1-phosphate transferase